MAASFFDAFTTPDDHSGFSRASKMSSAAHKSADNTPRFTPETRNQFSVYQDYLPEWKLINDVYRTKKLVLHQRMTGQLEKLCALEVDGWKDILEADQERHTHEKAVIHQVWRLQEERIKLNVGGQYFETSLSTLRRDPNSLLAAMFSGNGMISRDPDGSYFIDRDSTYFRLVLNYLRDLRIPPSIQEDPKIMEELMQEAMFYRLKDLLKLRWANLPVITQALEDVSSR
ncbi:BTB/POZ protein [Phycomyces nitens]|nr:BTB/POZ protein [Phycomyces nitens]